MSDVPIGTLKAKSNALKRHRGADSRAAVDARRELAAAVLEKRIREVVDAAPPLTAEQRDRLATLLRPTSGGSTDAA